MLLCFSVFSSLPHFGAVFQVCELMIRDMILKSLLVTQFLIQSENEAVIKVLKMAICTSRQPAVSTFIGCTEKFTPLYHFTSSFMYTMHTFNQLTAHFHIAYCRHIAIRSQHIVCNGTSQVALTITYYILKISLAFLSRK